MVAVLSYNNCFNTEPVDLPASGGSLQLLMESSRAQRLTLDRKVRLQFAACQNQENLSCKHVLLNCS